MNLNETRTYKKRVIYQISGKRNEERRPEVFNIHRAKKKKQGRTSSSLLNEFVNGWQNRDKDRMESFISYLEQQKLGNSGELWSTMSCNDMTHQRKLIYSYASWSPFTATSHTYFSFMSVIARIEKSQQNRKYFQQLYIRVCVSACLFLRVCVYIFLLITKWQ